MQEAIKLAKAQKATLLIVHVIDDSFVNYGEVYLDYDSLIKAKREQGLDILKKMDDLASKAHIKFQNHLIETKPFEGRVAEKIVEEASVRSADLLVIGTHGRRGFSRIFLGSVAENVIRIATLPVVLIRGEG
jgi:nucleotide-binding universal stress UspA family protein